MGEGFQVVRNGKSSVQDADSLQSSLGSVADLDARHLSMNGVHEDKVAQNGKLQVYSGPSNGYNRTLSALSSSSTKMQWSSVWIASLILFLVAVQFSIYFASLWPYMSQIDPTADQTFYGFTLAAYSAGQMISSPLLGYLSNRLKGARTVIALGVCFSMTGNLIYIFVEASPHNRKWILMAARFISGLGGGNAGTIRGYIATSSTLEHRARAVAIGTAALSLGVTAGPVVQACTTPIGYPGLIKGPFHLSQYTAPAFVSLCASIVLLILLFTKFTENYVGVDEKRKNNPYHFVPKFDRFAVFLCILCWFTMFFCITNAETVESPYTMAVFNWTNSDAVYYNSMIMAVSSFISFIMYTTFAVFAQRINERATVMVGLCMLLAFYALTFPWPFYTAKLDFKSVPTPAPPTTSLTGSTSLDVSPSSTNQTESYLVAGCDHWMEWCHYTPRLPLPVYLSSYPLISIGFPACNVAISTLFSKIIGPRRQGFVQSTMVMSGSLARLLGPILISWLFGQFGPRIAWAMTATVLSITIIAFNVQFSRLVPLKMKPSLKSGQKLRYDGGMLHHF